jgi:hypothetical protein
MPRARLPSSVRFFFVNFRFPSIDQLESSPPALYRIIQDPGIGVCPLGNTRQYHNAGLHRHRHGEKRYLVFRFLHFVYYMLHAGREPLPLCFVTMSGKIPNTKSYIFPNSLPGPYARVCTRNHPKVYSSSTPRHARRSGRCRHVSGSQ